MSRGRPAARATGRASAWAVAIAVALALAAPAAASAAAPANDDFAAAVELSGDSPAALGSTDEASAEPGEPNHGGDSAGTSVWYRWTPARSGLVRVGCQSGFETIVAVYRGASVAALSEVGTDPGTTPCATTGLIFRAHAGAAYRIAVDATVGGGGGSFLVELENESSAPVNDDFAARTPMRDLGGNATVTGTTEGAGREAGEPAHAGSPTGSSVWFTWTAARSGPTRVYPCHGSYHPVIEVYSGSAVDGLTPLSAPGEVGPVGLCALGAGGGVNFPAVAGQTYAIAVDGVDGEWGEFELQLLEAPLPRVPNPPQTLIRRKMKVHGATAKILFTAQGGRDARYLCKLDRARFRRCFSPKTYRGLRPGRHRFAVVAIGLDEFHDRDPTPAVRHFRIRRSGRRR